MRGKALIDRTEDRLIGHLGARFKLLQVASKRAQHLQPARPGNGRFAVVRVAARPLGHDLDRERFVPALCVDIMGKFAQTTAHIGEFETQAATFGQEITYPRLHTGPGVHAALPGHGNATADRLRLSSLA